jgi:hypothetical protein
MALPLANSAHRDALPRRLSTFTVSGRQYGLPHDRQGLAGGFGEVQLVVADEADAIAAEARLAQRRLGCFHHRMPVAVRSPLRRRISTSKTLHRGPTAESDGSVSRPAKTFTPKQGQYLAFIPSTRACTAARRPKPTCRNTSASAHLRFTRWC